MSHEEVWLSLRFVALFCSVCGSCWLLRAAWKPSYLFTRQLRHLAVADLGLSLAAPGYELALWILGDGRVPRSITFFSQCLFRFFLCAGCFIETEIAAGVMGSALRWQRFPRALGRTLSLSWLLAAVIGVGDALSQGGHLTPDHFAELVAVVLCTTFLLSLLMYFTSMLAVLWTPSPSAVVRRASQRALAFPCSFLITVFPQGLLYMGLGSSSQPWFGQVATLAVYSNGWVNAAVYSWQNRHICSGVDWRRLSVGRRALPEGMSRSSLGQSFHVGFGRVSRSYPQMVSSEALSESSKPSCSESQREVARASLGPSGTGPGASQLGVLFEVRSSEELCINARIDSYMLLQGQVLSLRQDGLLHFSTRPLWLDVASVLGENWVAETEGHAGVQIHLECYSNFSPSGRPSLATKCVQLPLQPGLWLISEASADRSAVSLVPSSVHSEEILTILSPSQSASSDSPQSGDFVQRREFDSWAAFMGS